jgi:hypothetical protein
MKYALFGDSHSQAVFPIVSESLNRLGNEVIAKSKAGWTLKKHLEDGMEGIIASFSPDVLVLSLGGNNQDLSDGYQQQIDRVLALVKRYGIKRVIWVSPAWAIRSDVQVRHEWTTNFLKKNLPRKIELIDIRPITKTGHRSDGVHFESSKYREWAELVSKHLLTKNAITLIPRWTWGVSTLIVILGLGISVLKRK